MVWRSASLRHLAPSAALAEYRQRRFSPSLCDCTTWDRGGQTARLRTSLPGTDGAGRDHARCRRGHRHRRATPPRHRRPEVAAQALAFAPSGEAVSSPVPVFPLRPAWPVHSPHLLRRTMRRALEGGELEVLLPAEGGPRSGGGRVECLPGGEHPLTGHVFPGRVRAIANTPAARPAHRVVLHEGLRRARGWIQSGRRYRWRSTWSAVR